MEISNQEQFEEFWRFCKESSLEEVVKFYGGGTIYVPSYKRMFRNKTIAKAYLEGEDIRALMRRYELSRDQIRRILKEQGVL